MIQNEFYMSFDNSDIKHIFDDDPFCNEYDDTAIMFHPELYNSVNLDDDS